MTADVRETPWSLAGQRTTATKAEVALREAGLDWTVSTRPIFGSMLKTGETPKKIEQLTEVPNSVAVTRDTDNKVLGIVGRTYRPLQNLDAFTFFDNLVDSGDIGYDTVGDLWGGKSIWLTGKIPESILINGEDPVDIYLLLRNSHNGSSAVTSAITPVRAQCENTLNLAIASAISKWSVRHTLGVEGRVKEARESLGLTFKYVEKFEEKANDLARTPMSDADFDAFIEKFTKELDLGERVMNEVQTRTREIFHDAENLENVRGTRWAALNAVGEYYDWDRPRSDQSRLLNTWFGTARKHRDVAARLLAR